MVVTITSHSSKAEIEASVKKLERGNMKRNRRSKNLFDAYAFCGVIKLKEDPLTTQKRMRNEWG